MAELNFWPAFWSQCKDSGLEAYVCHVTGSAVGVPDVQGVAGSPPGKLVVTSSDVGAKLGHVGFPRCLVQHTGGGGRGGGVSIVAEAVVMFSDCFM